MKTKIGLWIDHKKTVIVTIDGDHVEKTLIESKVEKQQRRYENKSSNPKFNQSDDIQDRQFTEHLNVYYNEIISSIRNAEAILIFGPGEAKGELINRIKKHKINGQVVGIETADKMTDPQIVAKVKQYFNK